MEDSVKEGYDIVHVPCCEAEVRDNVVPLSGYDATGKTELIIKHEEICEENRRKVEIVITEKGLEVLEKLDQQIENTEIEILKPLDIEEQRTLRSLINKMTLKN